MESGNPVAVLLHAHAYELAGAALAPYTRQGPIGRYIYCDRLQHVGPFIEMTFGAGSNTSGDASTMLVSVPMSWVLFIAQATNGLPPGFGSPP